MWPTDVLPDVSMLDARARVARRSAQLRRRRLAVRAMPAVAVAVVVLGLLLANGEGPRRVRTVPVDKRPSMVVEPGLVDGPGANPAAPPAATSPAGRRAGAGGAPATPPAQGAAPAASTSWPILYTADAPDRASLWIMDGDGANVRPVTPRFSSHGVLSADARRVAYTKVVATGPVGRWHLFVADVDGTEERLLAAPPRTDIWHVNWTPDGRHILFDSVQDYGGYFAPTSLTSDIWSVPVDGSSDPRLITRGVAPALSPDGTLLAFAGEADEGGIWTSAPDGSDRRRLTVNPAGSFTGDRVHGPAWSPDGSRIVYVERGAVKVMNRDGSGSQTLFDGDALDPVWSPDGSTIVFSRNGLDCEELTTACRSIWIMRADGTGARQLTPYGDYMYPSFPALRPI